MRKRFAEEQIIGFLKQADAGVAIKELCRQLAGFFISGGRATTSPPFFTVGGWPNTVATRPDNSGSIAATVP